MYTDDDFMEMGDLLPLRDGWYLDTATNIRFKLDEDGNPIDAHGMPIFQEVLDEEDYRE